MTVAKPQERKNIMKGKCHRDRRLASTITVTTIITGTTTVVIADNLKVDEGENCINIYS